MPTPIERLSRALADFPEHLFDGLPAAARRVFYAAVEVEKAYEEFLSTPPPPKVLPYPRLEVANDR